MIHRFFTAASGLEPRRSAKNRTDCTDNADKQTSVPIKGDDLPQPLANRNDKSLPFLAPTSPSQLSSSGNSCATRMESPSIPKNVRVLECYEESETSSVFIDAWHCRSPDASSEPSRSSPYRRV